MALTFAYSEEKNQLLKATRGVGFDEIITAISHGNLLADLANPSVKRANQRLYVVKIDRYAFAVPYVINTQRSEIFLKTVYPSRLLTKKYIKGANHD